jgi:hypothetical protein
MVYMEAMTTLILDGLFDAIEYTCWMYRSVSVKVHSSFVVMYAVLWLQANIDEYAEVIRMEGATLPQCRRQVRSSSLCQSDMWL